MERYPAGFCERGSFRFLCSDNFQTLLSLYHSMDAMYKHHFEGLRTVYIREEKADTPSMLVKIA